MSSSRKSLPDLKPGGFQAILEFFSRLQIGPGFVTLFVSLAVLSFLVTYEWGPDPRMYVLGEIADADIAAPNSFDFQDMDATRVRRDAAQKAQPLICVLNLEPVERMQDKVKQLFIDINKAESPGEMEALRIALADETGEDLSQRQFALLADPQVQGLVNNNVLPWLEQRLREGVVSDVRVVAGYTGGVIVRDLESGEVTSHLDAESIPGVRDLVLDLSMHVRSLQAGVAPKRLINDLLSSYVMPTLTPNLEDTAKNATEAARAVRPVVQHVMAGEIIVRQGEKINPEQLSKLRALFTNEGGGFKPPLFFGVMVCSFLLAGGLFFSHNTRGMEKISQKDLLFVAFILCFFTVLAKVFFMAGAVLSASSPSFTAGAQAFAVPVAGAAGIMAIATSSRRYYVTSMLLALFCSVVSNGGLALFIFYFMSAMFGTWLLADSQARKDVVKALGPLLLGQILMWLGTTLVLGGEPNRFFAEFIAVLLGGFLSMVLVFALSPLIEMLFGFTTRFSLIELMNQEHPVLRQLMFNAPGTYHHSMIVANMVELAAKAIGAHSLLCKVGALYHDIGKVEKPKYFIENQFRIDNPHERLTPTMSALVLVSHVKRGVEIAHKYRLGTEITDIIRQHHGNGVIQYFYQKAKAQAGQDQNVRIEDFTYDGPRPATREAALIMLADVVEASSRTLDNPTPSRIKMHVHRMIRAVLGEGQLNAVDLTFRDLEKVEESFTVILTGMFHKRIEYPGAQEPREPAAEPAAELAGAPSIPGVSRDPVEPREQAIPLPLPEEQKKLVEQSARRKLEAAGAGEDVLLQGTQLCEDDWYAGQWIDVSSDYDDLLHGRVRRKQNVEEEKPA